MQIKENLDKAKKEELKVLLKNLRLYKDLVRKIGKRGEKIYHNIFNGVNEYLVEYYGDLDKSYVLREAQEIYKNIFNIEVKDSDIRLVQSEKIKGGMKVYLNDNLLDLSFLKFYNLLKK
ncbi:MAG: hypothetical protein QM490_02245 [Candidatus Gracilibacteria bacterium]